MKKSDFKLSAPGRLVPVVGSTHPLVTQAFVPDLLPPRFEWWNELWPLLSDAESKVAHLAGAGSLLQDPQLLLSPLQQREAVKSSSLEGTFTDQEGQLAFRLDPTMPSSEADPANAYREVFNYGQAMKAGDELLQTLPLSTRLIRELHAHLMLGVRGQNKRPGEIRNSQVHIGNPPRFVPPVPGELDALLTNLERYMNEDQVLRPLVRAFVVHYQFETIHPFKDGNGRVGRLLLSLSLKHWLNLSSQWIYMSAYFDANKDDYIRLLYEVSTQGNWREWIEFCLLGVIEQASDAGDRCRRLLTLQDEFRQRIATIRASNRLDQIAHGLFTEFVVRVVDVRERFSVSYPTASQDLAKLERLGILRALTGQRVKTYFAPEIVQIAMGD